MASLESDGYCLIPPVIPADLLARANEHMDAVIAGEYETGVAPHRAQAAGELDPTQLVKIDQPHLSDRTILELVSHPELGRAVAEVVKAEMVQVWAVQLLHKPPGRAANANVGWHQDHHYWRTWWDGEVFTAWLPIVDVNAEMGPVRYVVGSQRWGYLEGSDFFGADLDSLRARLLPEGESWEEAAAVLPAGGAALHHRLTLHGSGANTSAMPRRSFAIHLRTDRSRPLEGGAEIYIGHLDDEQVCPVIYRA